MKRVTGIGGIFFKAENPEALRAWYKRNLGIDVQPWGGAVFGQNNKEEPQDKVTAWRITDKTDKSFAPSAAPFMINYLVDDLIALLTALREEGCKVIGEFDEGEQGKFGWILDPEGNKIELWQSVSKE